MQKLLPPIHVHLSALSGVEAWFINDMAPKGEPGEKKWAQFVGIAGDAGSDHTRMSKLTILHQLLQDIISLRNNCRHWKHVHVIATL